MENSYLNGIFHHFSSLRLSFCNLICFLLNVFRMYLECIGTSVRHFRLLTFRRSTGSDVIGHYKQHFFFFLFSPKVDENCGNSKNLLVPEMWKFPEIICFWGNLSGRESLTFFWKFQTGLKLRNKMTKIQENLALNLVTHTEKTDLDRKKRNKIPPSLYFFPMS